MNNISIVICTYNRLFYLKKALQSLLEQTLFQKKQYVCEIIVVDNNSTDGTLEYVREIQKKYSYVRYCKETRQGIGYARNTGLEQAQYDIIAYIDDDERAASDWAENILQVFQREDNVGCVGGPYYLEDKDKIPTWIPQSMYTVLGDVHLSDSESVTELFDKGLCGGNFAVHRKAYEQIGGFPLLGRKGELLLADEDDLYTKQIYQAGFRVLYNPQAIVHHALIESRMKLSYFMKHGKGMAYTRAKKCKIPKYFFELLWNILRSPVVIVLNYQERLKIFCRIASSYYKLEKSLKDLFL